MKRWPFDQLETVVLAVEIAVFAVIAVAIWLMIV